MIAAFDPSGMFVKDAMLLLHQHDATDTLKILTALLNSKVLGYLYRAHFATTDVLKNAILALPLPGIAGAITQCARLVPLIDQMLTLQMRLTQTRTPEDRKMVERQIEATDRQIDKLVYELYGLTDEEIEIVEKSVRS